MRALTGNALPSAPTPHLILRWKRSPATVRKTVQSPAEVAVAAEEELWAGGFLLSASEGH